MSRYLILVLIFLVGIIFPFIDYLAIAEVFILWLPLGVLFVAGLSWTIICAFKKDPDLKKAMFLTMLTPLFLFSQFISCYTVCSIQRYRSEKSISDLEKIKSITGQYPEKYESKIGIDYWKSKKENEYTIHFSRGFLVTEKFDSKSKKWNSFGWND